MTLDGRERVTAGQGDSGKCIKLMPTPHSPATDDRDKQSPVRHFLAAHMRYPNEPRRLYEQRIRAGFQHHPEAYWLYLLRWRFIGCFTFPRPKLAPQVRGDMFNAALRETYRQHGCYFPNALWFRCYELGTRKDLTPHVHFLIAGIPRHLDPAVFAHRLKADWLGCGGGTAWVEEYNPRLDGGTYCAKRETPAFGEHAWEDCDPTFSDAARALLRRRQRERGVQHPDS